jgi:hypothetical protein
MAGQLIPPRELAPAVPEGLQPHQYISMWADLYDTCEQFLLARLREEVGAGGDVRAAYQKWYDAKMNEHDRTVQHMIDELTRREKSCQLKL